MACEPDRKGGLMPPRLTGPNDPRLPGLPFRIPPWTPTGPITSIDWPNTICIDVEGVGIVCGSVPEPLSNYDEDQIVPPFTVGDVIGMHPIFPPTWPPQWVVSGDGRSIDDGSGGGGGPGMPGPGPGLPEEPGGNGGFPAGVECDRSTCCNDDVSLTITDCTDACEGGAPEVYGVTFGTIPCAENAEGSHELTFDSDCLWVSDNFNVTYNGDTGVYRWELDVGLGGLPGGATLTLTHVSGDDPLGDAGLTIQYIAENVWCCACSNVMTLNCPRRLSLECTDTEADPPEGVTWHVCVEPSCCPVCDGGALATAPATNTFFGDFTATEWIAVARGNLPSSDVRMRLDCRFEAPCCEDHDFDAVIDFSYDGDSVLFNSYQNLTGSEVYSINEDVPLDTTGASTICLMCKYQFVEDHDIENYSIAEDPPGTPDCEDESNDCGTLVFGHSILTLDVMVDGVHRLRLRDETSRAIMNANPSFGFGRQANVVDATDPATDQWSFRTFGDTDPGCVVDPTP